MKRGTVVDEAETITVHISLTFRKRGGRKTVVTPDGAAWSPRPRVDNALVNALARAFRWPMRARGLGDPLSVVSEGAPDVIKAIKTFPRSGAPALPRARDAQPGGQGVRGPVA